MTPWHTQEAIVWEKSIKYTLNCFFSRKNGWSPLLWHLYWELFQKHNKWQQIHLSYDSWKSKSKTINHFTTLNTWTTFFKSFLTQCSPLHPPLCKPSNEKEVGSAPLSFSMIPETWKVRLPVTHNHIKLTTNFRFKRLTCLSSYLLFE